mgnify:CR=1 FL=1
MSYKGGVAKTTTSTCLAVCLSELGYKVLVIDMDGQGNVSQSLGVYDPRSEEACIADVLYQATPSSPRMSLSEVMRTTDYENVFCVPSNFRFADADTRLKAEIAGGVDTAQSSNHIVHMFVLYLRQERKWPAGRKCAVGKSSSNPCR